LPLPRIDVGFEHERRHRGVAVVDDVEVVQAVADHAAAFRHARRKRRLVHVAVQAADDVIARTA
jgi:hypothetical protein